MQMKALGQLNSLKEGRELIARSFPLKVYEPYVDRERQDTVSEYAGDGPACGDTGWIPEKDKCSSDGAARRSFRYLLLIEETIRRDLEKLESEGYVTRTYGGAVSAGHGMPVMCSIGVRETQVESGGKRRIARKVADMIGDDETLMLGYPVRLLCLSAPQYPEKGDDDHQFGGELPGGSGAGEHRDYCDRRDAASGRHVPDRHGGGDGAGQILCQ